MAAKKTYPGVYIEEISSGVRTITGVSTSVAAFIGGASKGPTDKATLVTSYAEYARLFGAPGGLDLGSNLGYAVNAFFRNGGQETYIVRLVGGGATASSVDLGGLVVNGSSPGVGPHEYGVASKKTPAGEGNAEDLFQLTVYRRKFVEKQDEGKGFGVADGPTIVETFEKLSMKKEHPRYVKKVVDAESTVIRVKEPEGTSSPPDTATSEILAKGLVGGSDGKVLDPSTAPDAFIEALNVPPKPEDPPEPGKGGVALLEAVDLFNLLCVPGLTPDSDKSKEAIQRLANYCLGRRAFYLVDAPETALDAEELGTIANKNSAIYFPWVTGTDPLAKNRPRAFPPSGFVAGIYARTDASRGVWKAPAGIEATLTGVLSPKTPLTDVENGNLNPRAVNCIRNFSGYGTVLWGARTLDGDDEKGSEWKCVPVRRVALFIEETLFRALKWVVFEPNDEPLWSQVRLNVGAFMNDMYRQGAFQGATPQEAYFVKCDRETTTQNDIDKGIVNVVVGFAPLKPAEFVVVQIQQIAGQVAA